MTRTALFLAVACACSRDQVPGTVRGTGWSGDVLVLEGTINAGPRVRETITRRGERRFDAVWESNTDGTWSAYSVETLTR
jgi:hypothetical protein